MRVFLRLFLDELHKFLLVFIQLLLFAFPLISLLIFVREDAFLITKIHLLSQVIVSQMRFLNVLNSMEAKLLHKEVIQFARNEIRSAHTVNSDSAQQEYELVEK